MSEETDDRDPTNWVACSECGVAAGEFCKDGCSFDAWHGKSREPAHEVIERLRTQNARGNDLLRQLMAMHIGFHPLRASVEEHLKEASEKEQSTPKVVLVLRYNELYIAPKFNTTTDDPRRAKHFASREAALLHLTRLNETWRKHAVVDEVTIEEEERAL